MYTYDNIRRDEKKVEEGENKGLWKERRQDERTKENRKESERGSGRREQRGGSVERKRGFTWFNHSFYEIDNFLTKGI